MIKSGYGEKREILFTASVKMVAEVGEKVAEVWDNTGLVLGEGRGREALKHLCRCCFLSFHESGSKKKEKKLKVGLLFISLFSVTNILHGGSTQ